MGKKVLPHTFTIIFIYMEMDNKANITGGKNKVAHIFSLYVGGKSIGIFFGFQKKWDRASLIECSRFGHFYCIM